MPRWEMDLIRVAPKKPINLMRLHGGGCYLIRRIIIAFDWNSSGGELVPRSPLCLVLLLSSPFFNCISTSWERFVPSKFLSTQWWGDVRQGVIIPA